MYNCVAVGRKVSADAQQVYVSLDSKPVIISETALSDNSPIDGLAVYTFNRVYDSSASQHDVFANSVKPCVDSILQGINSTIFAYGQTGTGKTYTMFGKESDLSHEINENSGMAPRVIMHLFDNLGK